MTNRILVCPFDESIINTLHHEAVVVTINDPRDVVPAAAEVRKSNMLHAVSLHISLPLSFIHFEREWAEVPLALYAPSMGDFKTVADMLPILRMLNIRIFLPADKKESYTSARILSSLKVPVGLSFNGSSPDWETMSDLMHFAVYSRVEHAPIEPFDYLINNYRINDRTDFDSVYFNDSSRYLHISKEGRVGLSFNDIAEDQYIADSIADIQDIENMPEYRNNVDKWQEHFHRSDGCAYCGGWRACLGKFFEVTEDRKACGKFFTEVMEAAENNKKIHGQRRELWQP